MTRVTRVKLFSAEYGQDLEEAINRWLDEMGGAVEVVNVSVQASGWKWHALVVYC